MDIIVATLAKLGEKVSTGAWIYALGNGLRQEFKECKDGILYSKTGFDNVMSVKTKLLSEEAVLTSKSKKHHQHAKTTTDVNDEIALKLQEIKLSKKRLKTPQKIPRTKPPKTPPSCISKGREEKVNLKARTTAGTHGTTHSGINHGRHQPKGKAKGKTQQNHLTLKVSGVTYIRSTVTLPSGALITRTAQAESQLQPPDLGAILATHMGIPLPLVGPTHPYPLKGKGNHNTPKVKVVRERTVTVTGNGKAQIFQQDAQSKLHPPYMTNHLLITRPNNAGTIAN